MLASAKYREVSVRMAAAPRDAALLRTLRLLHALVQQFLCMLQHTQSALGQILPRAVHIKRQHPHAGRWPLRRNLLRSQAPRNRRSILLEQPFLWIGRLGIYPGGPLPLAVRAAVRGAARRRPATCRPATCRPAASGLFRCSSFRARPARLGRSCWHYVPPSLSDAHAKQKRFIRGRCSSISNLLVPSGNGRQFATVLGSIVCSRRGCRPFPRATRRG
jgi:hypothetical protein